MTLNPHPHFPSAGGYVLKLHRDAVPQQGRLCGRIEHIASGDAIDFTSGDGLLDWLGQHALRVLPPPAPADCAHRSEP